MLTYYCPVSEKGEKSGGEKLFREEILDLRPLVISLHPGLRGLERPFRQRRAAYRSRRSVTDTRLKMEQQCERLVADLFLLGVRMIVHLFLHGCAHAGVKMQLTCIHELIGRFRARTIYGRGG